MAYDYSTLVMIACGLAFVVITRLHLASITSRATADRLGSSAEIATEGETQEAPAALVRPSTTLNARPPAAATRIIIKPGQTPGSSHAA